MARNPVQFQRGMSLAMFRQRYGSDEQCHEALISMRWPSGFVCPACAGRSHSYCKPRRLFQSAACGHQASVKAGTIFHRAKVPLTKWFLAIYLLAQSKNDISAMELMRQLGVRYDTAALRDTARIGERSRSECQKRASEESEWEVTTKPLKIMALPTG